MTIVTTNLESVRAGSGGDVDWQQALKLAVRDARQLCELLRLPPEFGEQARQATGAFPLFAPLEYVSRMRMGDPNDPLLRQVMPIAEETNVVEGYSHDPVGDGAAALTPSLLKKYHGRALLVTTGACAVHCRYCFRRHYPYSESPPNVKHWQQAMDRIGEDESVSEVLLSGGDPLTLVDEHVAWLFARLAEIPHVRRVRIHTRLPIVIPQRVTPPLLDAVVGTRLQAIMVIHANHPNEIDQHVSAALDLLTQSNVMLFNQSVLLKGVNDEVRALVELSNRLIENRVVPYYLHALDPVHGGAHFDVERRRALELIQRMRGQLPGYAVPRYVREVAGEPSKRVIA